MTNSTRQAAITSRLTLLRLSGMGPARVRWLLAEHEDPAAVLALLLAGRLPSVHTEPPPGVDKEMLETWRRELGAVDQAELYKRQAEEGRRILLPWDPEWPFDREPEPPLMLFCEGDIDLLAHRPAIAVVGTRRCTSVGRSVAHQLGLDLAQQRVAVVSGLALGVDAAAHQGALDGGGAAIGVVGTGLDVIYPKRNRSLWSEVAGAGLLISEYPAGTQPDRWHFPARNRLIAALSDGVVIVESHARGGSLLTADEAIDRGVPVMAVPGAVVNAAADGSNGLIVDGAIPVRNASDVMMSIGYVSAEESIDQPEQPRIWPPNDDGPGQITLPLADLILREAGNGAVSIDRLVVMSGQEPVDVVAEIEALASRGLVNVDGTTVTWRGDPA